MLGRLLVLPLVAVTSAGLLAVGSASAAQDDYPPPEPLLSVSPATVVVGESVTVSGEGFEPGEQVEISVSTTPFAAPSLEQDGAEEPVVAIQPAMLTVPEVESVVKPAVDTEPAPAVVAPVVAAAQPVQTVTADGSGAFSTSVKMTEVGKATITATGQGSGLSASAMVTVLAPKQAKAGLPETGNAGWSLVRIGSGALGLGAVLLLATLFWRSRRNRADTHTDPV